MEAAIPVETDRIDRVAPTRRPSGNPVMFQSWRRLLFLHWEVPVEALRPLVPPQLAIDTYDGRAYVGLVPFTMMGVRPVWTPAFKPLSDFHEVNVRTYVHLDGADPGVWFLSLDAANALAVRIARSAWKLPYHFAEMDLSVSLNPEDVVAADGYAVGIGDWTETVDYRSSRRWPGPVPADCTVSYSPRGPICPAAAGTLEHFLAERYLLYSTDGARLYRGQVHHEAYPLQTAEAWSLNESLVRAAGIDRPSSAPLVHYAHGVDVEIFPLGPTGA
ncbi:MAG TPA: DUF2071 domain-containing protein [Chthonomonadaceae bacterium]|nr:DUF2071 domain-containing protein [Chthonomonadaceae bacterium]